MSNNVPEDAAYVFETVTVPDDSDDDFNYSNVNVISAADDDADEEGLATTLQHVQVAKCFDPESEISAPSLVDRPEVVEDYVRNFLISSEMNRTITTFQAEWYELKSTGKLRPDPNNEVVPDCYVDNTLLRDEMAQMKKEHAAALAQAQKSNSTASKLKKERDYHRLNHRRIKEEKRLLLNEIERLKEYYAGLEIENAHIRKRYENATRNKTLAELKTIRAEDALAATTKKLADTVQNEEVASVPGSGVPATAPSLPAPESVPEWCAKTVGNATMAATYIPTGSVKLGPAPSSNPFVCDRAREVSLTTTFKAHDASVSGIAFHPTDKTFATCSDDKTWKLWTAPAGELLLQGSGHTEWISSCEFNPDGSKLATSSGDATVRIWDLKTAECSAVFTEHSHAIWDTSFHYSGDFILSASLDGTVKLWDLCSGRCRQTFRGHDDSVNSVNFQPFSNLFVTGSADSVVQLWDSRTGQSIKRLVGHRNAVNAAVFNSAGTRIASTDAIGETKIWDVQTGACLLTLKNKGNGAGIHAAFDASGAVLTVASADNTISLFDAETGELLNRMQAHRTTVERVGFEKTGEFMVTSGADCTIRVWC